MVAETAPAEVTEQVQTPAPEPTAAADESTELASQEVKTEDSASVSTEGTEPEAQESFDVTALPEYQEAVKQPVGESKPEPEIPGTPLEKLQAEAALQRAQNYQTLMRQGDAVVRETVKRLGLSDDEANAVWQAVGPYLNGMHANADEFYTSYLNESIKQALPEKDRQAFFQRAYKSYPEAFSAIHTLGATSKEAEWKAKVEAGEYVSKAQVQKIAQAAFNQGRGAKEKAGEVPGADAGNTVNGTSNGRRFRTETELNRAFNNDEVDRATYASEYKRLTGKEP